LPSVTEARPKSFQEYVGIIEQHQSRSKKSLWYRGCNDSNHQLLPSLYRHDSVKGAADLATLEEHLILRFRQRSIPFAPRPLGDEWDVLFLMQHYGIPTRLLDWTENPFIGLFFSVTGGQFTRKGRRRHRYLHFTNDAVVWLLDPVAWNRHALSRLDYAGEIPFTNDEVLNPYKPPLKRHDFRNLPVAINGAHNSARIVAQRGAFTIAGDNLEPLEVSFAENKFPDECLVKVILARELIPELRHSILNHGITESVVFPDLDGLSREMNREFGFKD